MPVRNVYVVHLSHRAVGIPALILGTCIITCLVRGIRPGNKSDDSDQDSHNFHHNFHIDSPIVNISGLASQQSNDSPDWWRSVSTISYATLSDWLIFQHN